MPRLLVLLYLGLVACSGSSGAKPIDAAPPSDTPAIDAQPSYPIIGTVWRETVWEDFLLEMNVAALTSSHIVMATPEELALLDFTGEVVERGTWPADLEPPYRQRGSVRHGDGVALLLTGPGLDFRLLTIGASLEAVEPVLVENLTYHSIFSTSDTISIVNSGASLEGDWLELLTHDGADVIARDLLDDRQWVGGNSSLLTAEGNIVDCRMWAQAGDLYVLRVDPVGKTLSTLLLVDNGQPTQASLDYCQLLAVEDTIIAVWTMKDSFSPTYQYAAVVSADGSTLLSGPTLIQEVPDDPNQHVAVGNRIVSLAPDDSPYLYSFDATTLEALPTYRFDIGELHDYVGSGLRLLSDGSDLYLAFAYNQNGQNYTPVEVAKLEPFPN